MKKYVTILIIVLLLIIIVGAIYFKLNNFVINPGQSDQVFCTKEAKLCPDGKTYVGRQGPECEFSRCPDTEGFDRVDNVNNLKSVESGNNQNLDQVACTAEAKLCSDGKTYVGRQGPKCEFADCPKL